MTDTTYVDPIPPALQPSDRQPFTKMIAMRTGPGEVKPGDVLSDRILTLPQERTVCLTLGTVFNTPADFAVPLQAVRQLPVNAVVTCGYGADPVAFAGPRRPPDLPAPRGGPIRQRRAGGARRRRYHLAAKSGFGEIHQQRRRRVLNDPSYAAAARRIRSDVERLPDPSTVIHELTRAAN
jgi:hypothetical protein